MKFECKTCVAGKSINQYSYCTIQNVVNGTYYGRGGEFWEIGTWNCAIGVESCYYEFSYFEVVAVSCIPDFEMIGKICVQKKPANNTNSSNTNTTTIIPTVITCPNSN